MSESQSAKSQSESESLPLDWTRVRRQRCKDPKCARRPLPFNPRSGDDNGNNSSSTSTTTISGQAIFCWHKIDPEWFQGYLSHDTGNRKPIGLLAEQTEIDECLECQDGGYRRIKLTVFTKPKKLEMTEIEWTGGDMMVLNGERVDFVADKVLTGMKAVPFVNQYFKALLDKLQDHGEEGTVLELLPDVTILIGKMRMAIPSDGDL